LDEILGSFLGHRVGFPIIYPGIPIVLGGLRLVHVQGVHDKAISKLSGWQRKLQNPLGGGAKSSSAFCTLLLASLLTDCNQPPQSNSSNLLTKSAGVFSGQVTSSYME
jgi:hypothetical protein